MTYTKEKSASVKRSNREDETIPDAREKTAEQKVRFAANCAQLDSGEEQALADIGASTDLSEWPEY